MPVQGGVGLQAVAGDEIMQDTAHLILQLLPRGKIYIRIIRNTTAVKLHIGGEGVHVVVSIVHGKGRKPAAVSADIILLVPLRCKTGDAEQEAAALAAIIGQVVIIALLLVDADQVVPVFIAASGLNPQPVRDAVGNGESQPAVQLVKRRRFGIFILGLLLRRRVRLIGRRRLHAVDHGAGPHRRRQDQGQKNDHRSGFFVFHNTV